jgi:hypothetical protein
MAAPRRQSVASAENRLEADVSRILKATSSQLHVLSVASASAEAPLDEHQTIDTYDAAELDAALNRVVEACRPLDGRVMGGIIR